MDPAQYHIRANYLRPLGVAQDKILCGPSKVAIAISSVCNIQCDYCPYHSALAPPSSPKSQESFLDLRTIKEIISTAAFWKVKEITLTGEGEPTSHPDIMTIIHAIKQEKISLNICTNAAFPSKILPAIVKSDNLYIDLCTPDKANYQKIQAPASPHLFDKVISNIKKLNIFAQKYGRPNLQIDFVMTNTNYRLIPQFLTFMENLNVHNVRFKFFRPEERTFSLSLTPEDKNNILTILNTSKSKLLLKHNVKEIQEAFGNATPAPPTHCYCGWYELFISPDKRVTFCCINRKLEIGNLNQNNLREIWESQKAHDIRLKSKYSFSDLASKACAHCLWPQENHARDLLVKNINKVISRSKS